MRKRRLLSLSAVVAGLVLGMGALALGGSAQAQESPQATLDAAVEAWNAGDAEAFAALFNDEGLQTEFGTTRADAVEFLEGEMEGTGPIASAELSDLRLEGGAFTGIVDIQFEAGISLYEEWTFVETADGYVIGPTEPASRPIPPGVPAVDMTLQEYAFVYNEAAIQAADGNFAFDVTNVGEEEHEIVVLSIDSDQSLLELLQASDPESEELPAGVEFVTFGGFFPPGAEGTTLFDQPLGPGKYGLVCFVPSPEGVPHAFLGMVSEFEISGGLAGGGGTSDGGAGGGSTGGGGTGGGPITPPSTGSGGLLDGATTSSSIMLAMASVLVVAGLGGLFALRRA